MQVNCKLIKYFIFSLVIVMELIACGGGNASGGASVLNAEITGDINVNYVASKPIVECYQDILEVVDEEQSSRATFQIEIPMQLLHQGDHPLIGLYDYNVSNRVFSFNKDSKYVRLAYEALNEKSYGANVKGTISFTSIPKKIGEHLIGHLKGTAQAGVPGRDAEGVINIDMQFDILADKSVFNCQ